MTELEKVISAMKKVMEKLQNENDSLKKSANTKVHMNCITTQIFACCFLSFLKQLS